MRPPPHPLVLAAVLGAATGAIAAWLLEGTQRLDGSKHAATHTTLTRNSSPAQGVAAEQRLDPGLQHAMMTATAPTTLLPSSSAAPIETTPAPDVLAAATADPAASNPPTTSAATVEANAEVERAFHAILWSKAVDAIDAEKSCVTGSAIACLELAEHEDSIQAFGKSRAHRERAYAILVLQCHRREPDACVTIARMHALGLGIARDVASERALFARAKTLCKSRQGKVCAAMNP